MIISPSRGLSLEALDQDLVTAGLGPGTESVIPTMIVILEALPVIPGPDLLDHDPGTLMVDTESSDADPEVGRHVLGTVDAPRLPHQFPDGITTRNSGILTGLSMSFRSLVT